MKIMGMTMQVILMLGCLASIAYATLSNANVRGAQGTATHYSGPYIPSECFGHEDKGIMVAEASDPLWNNGAACGQMYIVRCIGAFNQSVSQPCRNSSNVLVTIVDYCPPTKCQGTLDLSKEAFSQIAYPNFDKINIAFSLV